MWIDRNYAITINRMAQAFPAVLVTGPRQVGKTSLLRHYYPNHTYVSFDQPSEAERAEQNPDMFLKTGNPSILDEIQYVPSLFRHLKIAVDRGVSKGQFLLTGSQTFGLMQGVSESLAGRCAVVQMHGLSYEELKPVLPELTQEDFMVKGGYPALYSQSNLNVSDWYASYVATYLERDVRNVKQVANLRDFNRLLRAIAVRTGQILSYADLAKDVDVTPNTVKAWVSVLEASRQIYILEPYHRSLGKRLTKAPKIYMMDTGLACHLAGIQNWNQLWAAPMAGAIWETYVVTQLLKHFQSQGQDTPLWYWRSDSNEVDILIERGGRLIAMECKLTETPGADALKGINALKHFYEPGTVESAYVVCRSSLAHPVAKTDIQAVNVNELLNLIK